VRNADREAETFASEALALRSAGGVVASGEGAGLRIAVMRSTHSTWVLPKGQVEPGETTEQAARREIAEEIGAGELEWRGHLGWTEHRFERDVTSYRKRVEWFLFIAPAGSPLCPRIEENVLDCGWFTPEQAMSLLSHPNQRRMLRRALARLDQG
jgi:8-oxo-dGTP pyrophosphatase MutT (NUDIX family)